MVDEARPEDAAAFVNKALADKPELTVEAGDLPSTAKALRDLFSAAGQFFDRGGPVRVVQREDGSGPMVSRLDVNTIVNEAHTLCRPVKFGEEEKQKSVTLPNRVAMLYLALRGEWHLPPLAGISSAPLLNADGAIRSADGYDEQTALYCRGVPDVAPMVPMAPTPEDARAALRLLRETFRTFPFADAVRVSDPSLGVDVVDLSLSPRTDESGFLAALLTAVCRPSLSLAPGAMFTAPKLSGAGSGKGLLVRAISMIAYGLMPRPFTMGGERQELDKRLGAELMEAYPILLLDNANGAVLRSDTLASVMTERPARGRVLGESRMVEFNSAAFITITGNALTPSEDLVRRFLHSHFDAQCEDAESRPFKPGFLKDIQAQRLDLLVACLTIWRFGRQNAPTLTRGKPLGSYETWAEWVRDPLLTLECRDPVERIAEAKARDPHRQHVVAIFEKWWERHGSSAMKVTELHEEVTTLIDPHGKGRQFVAARVGELVDTRAAGFVMTRSKGGRWSAATYQLEKSDHSDARGADHRDDRDHQGTPANPVPPMAPMPKDGSERARSRPRFVYRPRDLRVWRSRYRDNDEDEATEVGKMNIDPVLAWMTEREAIRIKKERDDPPPWTADPILASNRFCNVRREDDRTTRWIRANIRERFAGHPHLWFMLCIARQINWQDTLAELIRTPSAWPSDSGFAPSILGQAMEARHRRGMKVETAAYMIRAEREKSKPWYSWSKQRYVAEIVLGQLWEARQDFAEWFARPAVTLRDTHAKLKSFYAWGDFLAYQAVVDMRFTPLLAQAPDVADWAAAGPGTIRGLNRIHGRTVEHKVSQEQALAEMRALEEALRRETSIEFDFSDVPNLLCETDKWLRMKNGEGQMRSRYLPVRQRSLAEMLARGR